MACEDGYGNTWPDRSLHAGLAVGGTHVELFQWYAKDVLKMKQLSEVRRRLLNEVKLINLNHNGKENEKTNFSLMVIFFTQVQVLYLKSIK